MTLAEYLMNPNKSRTICSSSISNSALKIFKTSRKALDVMWKGQVPTSTKFCYIALIGFLFVFEQ